MKLKMFLLLITATVFFMSCDSVMHEQNRNVLGQFTETPVIITWDGSKAAGVQSFEANVQVFAMNNRRDTHATLDNTYRLAISTIDNRIVTRIDFDDPRYSSIISDGKEALVLDPVSEEITYRIPLGDLDSSLNRIFENQTTMSRINLSLVREEANRLSLNMKEEAGENGRQLLLEIPPSMIPQNGLDRITSSRVVFNLTNETIMETEVIMVREDGTVVTTTATPVYEDMDGIPIKIGMVTVIDSKAPYLIEGFDPDMSFFNSLDEIPLLDESQFAEMKAAGGIYEIPDMIFGDPADLSFVETIFVIYHDIHINSAPEHLFRSIIQNKEATR